MFSLSPPGPGRSEGLGGEALLPLSHLAARLAQDPPPDGDDEARLLGNGEELRRGHQTPLRVAPPHEGLEPDDVSAREGDDGLIVHDEVVPVHRGA